MGPAADVDACYGENAPRDYTDDAESLVFTASVSGKGLVTINIDLPSRRWWLTAR